MLASCPACHSTPSDSLTVFEISRMAIHNGPGIRTMIHFKGCPLRCIWCSTPESQIREPQLALVESRCISCGSCILACEANAISFNKNDTPTIIWDSCNHCGHCADVCCSDALSMIGKYYTVDSLFDIILKDEVIFKNSNGGVTFSGGEPLMCVNDSFLHLLSRLWQANISIGIDTTGYVSKDVLDSVLPYVDFFLWDMKQMAPDVHKKYTGVDNSLILENLRYVDQYGTAIYLRCPIIPGISDSMEHIKKLVTFASELMHVVEVDLLPLHHMGTSRYEKIGLVDHFAEVAAPSQDSLDSYKSILEQAGFRVRIIK